MNHQVSIRVGDREVLTLEDILPEAGPLKMLMVAKTPALLSVKEGHYFQGSQGQLFWNRLKQYGLLDVPPGTYEDDVLAAHGYGLTDIVKMPRDYGDEPSDDEYRHGLERILALIACFQPLVVLFVYKRVLDQILRFGFKRREKARYGFNDDLATLFNARVFAFPMPGTPCKKAEAAAAMTELAQCLQEECT